MSLKKAVGLTTLKFGHYQGTAAKIAVPIAGANAATSVTTIV
jgi:hypothetical protein